MTKEFVVGDTYYIMFMRVSWFFVSEIIASFPIWIFLREFYFIYNKFKILNYKSIVVQLDTKKLSICHNIELNIIMKFVQSVPDDFGTKLHLHIWSVSHEFLVLRKRWWSIHAEKKTCERKILFSFYTGLTYYTDTSWS